MDIYVGNLSTNVTEDDLKILFEAYGTVLATTLIRDRERGVNKGYGFVKMHNAIDAARAIDDMNGRIVSGRNLVVHVAKSRQEQSNFNREERSEVYEQRRETPSRQESSEQWGSRPSFQRPQPNQYDRIEQKAKEEDIPIEVIDEAAFELLPTEDGYVRINFN